MSQTMQSHGIERADLGRLFVTARGRGGLAERRAVF